jgi:hypothetical protein
MPELSLEIGVVHNLHEATLDPRIVSETFPAIPQEPLRRRVVRRPDWLSIEIVALVVGATDFCLILAAAAAAFATYSGVMDQTVAEPGSHLLTSIFAATLFVGLFERLRGYRLKQLSRLHWQLTRMLMTWDSQ